MKKFFIIAMAFVIMAGIGFGTTNREPTDLEVAQFAVEKNHGEGYEVELLESTDPDYINCVAYYDGEPRYCSSYLRSYYTNAMDS